MYKNMILNIICKLDIQSAYDLISIFPEYELLDHKKIMGTILTNVNKFQDIVHSEDLLDKTLLSWSEAIIVYPSDTYLQYLRENDYKLISKQMLKSEAKNNSNLRIGWCDRPKQEYYNFVTFDEMIEQMESNFDSYDEYNDLIFNDYYSEGPTCFIFKNETKLEIPYSVFKLYQKYGDKLIHEFDNSTHLGKATDEDIFDCNEFQDYFPLYIDDYAYGCYMIGINCNPESKYYSQLGLYVNPEFEPTTVDLHINLDPLLDIKDKEKLKEFFNKNYGGDWDTHDLYKIFKSLIIM